MRCRFAAFALALLCSCSPREESSQADSAQAAPAAAAPASTAVGVALKSLKSPGDTLDVALVAEDGYSKLLDDYLSSLPAASPASATSDSSEAGNWLSFFERAVDVAERTRGAIRQIAQDIDSTEVRRQGLVEGLGIAVTDSINTKLSVDRTKFALDRWSDSRERDQRASEFQAALRAHQGARSVVLGYNAKLKGVGTALYKLNTTARLEFDRFVVVGLMPLPEIDLESILRFRPMGSDGRPIAIRTTPTSADLRFLGVSDCKSGNREVYVNKDLDRRVPPIVLAFYQYHEFAHHTLGHIPCDGARPPAISPHTKELAADCEAVRLLREKFGEDGNRIGFAVVGQLNGISRSITETHPSDVQRAINLQKPNCGA